MRVLDIDPILNHSSFHTWKKKDLVNALNAASGVTGLCLCIECKNKDKPACPAYDAPMSRTSLRIRSCSEGIKAIND